MFHNLAYSKLPVKVLAPIFVAAIRMARHLDIRAKLKGVGTIDTEPDHPSGVGTVILSKP
jgi:hypothetical protein